MPTATEQKEDKQFFVTFVSAVGSALLLIFVCYAVCKWFKVNDDTAAWSKTELQLVRER
jgi:hypothetical protein